MNLILSGMLWSECLVYLDDIIIFGRMFKEHLGHLASVLGRLHEDGLKPNLRSVLFSKKKGIILRTCHLI